MIHKYEDTTADARDKLYHVLQELYQENFETVKKFSCLKNCLKIFVDRQTNAKEAADARKSLLIFFPVATSLSVAPQAMTKKRFLILWRTRGKTTAIQPSKKNVYLS